MKIKERFFVLFNDMMCATYAHARALTTGVRTP